jgi:hypothetical protein
LKIEGRSARLAHPGLIVTNLEPHEPQENAMNLASVRAQDIVKCNVKGRVFYAVVDGPERGGLAVSPIGNGVSYRQVTSRQVVAHYLRSKRSHE